MTRVKSAQAETMAYTCRDYSRPPTFTFFFFFINNIMSFWDFTYPKEAAHMSASVGVRSFNYIFKTKCVVGCAFI